MWDHRLTIALRNRLGDNREATTKQVGTGHSKAIIVGSGSFSLKVNRRDGTGEVALISIGGGPHLIFPNRKKLNRGLPNRKADADVSVSLITTMRCDGEVREENAHPHLPLDSSLDAVLRKSVEFALCF